MREYETEFGRWYSRLPYGARAELARKAGTSQAYLSDLAAGRRKAGMDIASRLMWADRENITLAMLRPDKFAEDES